MQQIAHSQIRNLSFEQSKTIQFHIIVTTGDAYSKACNLVLTIHVYCVLAEEALQKELLYVFIWLLWPEQSACNTLGSYRHG